MHNHPKGNVYHLGETDELGAFGQYIFTSNAARSNTDDMINDLWAYLQTIKYTRVKLTLLITTDHGREYMKNGHLITIIKLTPGSNEIWFLRNGARHTTVAR